MRNPSKAHNGKGLAMGSDGLHVSWCTLLKRVTRKASAWYTSRNTRTEPTAMTTNDLFSVALSIALQSKLQKDSQCVLSCSAVSLLAISITETQ
eukprot:4909590-Prymnesium_polylepis.2